MSAYDSYTKQLSALAGEVIGSFINELTKTPTASSVEMKIHEYVIRITASQQRIPALIGMSNFQAVLDAQRLHTKVLDTLEFFIGSNCTTGEMLLQKALGDFEQFVMLNFSHITAMPKEPEIQRNPKDQAIFEMRAQVSVYQQQAAATKFSHSGTYGGASAVSHKIEAANSAISYFARYGKKGDHYETEAHRAVANIGAEIIRQKQ